MERRLHLGNIRGMDAITLQVSIADAVRKPIRQLEPVSVLDLLALSEACDAHPALSKMLTGFAERVAKEVGEIPSGSVWRDLVSDFGSVDAGRVPDTFRHLFRSEVEGRGEPVLESVPAVLERWTASEPTPFVISGNQAKIQRSTRTAKPAGGGEKRTAQRKARTVQKKEIDPVRQKFLRNLCLERLRGYTENGLSEKILVTGIAFAAKGTYANVSPAEVVAVMRELEKDGVARRTAGRWILGRVW